MVTTGTTFAGAGAPATARKASTWSQPSNQKDASTNPFLKTNSRIGTAEDPLQPLKQQRPKTFIHINMIHSPSTTLQLWVQPCLLKIATGPLPCHKTPKVKRHVIMGNPTRTPRFTIQLKALQCPTVPAQISYNVFLRKTGKTIAFLITPVAPSAPESLLIGSQTMIGHAPTKLRKSAPEL